MDDDINKIIERIEEILLNPANEPIDMLGSYIVGATIVRDDIGRYYEKYPLLERVADLGADLETLGGSKHADGVLREIKIKFEELKSQVETKNS
jgi:hypothetical protein